MKTFYIYNIQTDEFYGTVKATNIASAEVKALAELNINESSVDIAAFTEKLF